jgi:hypothetical protein
VEGRERERECVCVCVRGHTFPSLSISLSLSLCPLFLRYQRTLQKKMKRIADLEAELAVVQASERGLLARCRNLVNEIAVLRKVPVSPRQDTSMANSNSNSGSRDSRGERRTGKDREKDKDKGRRSASAERRAAGISTVQPRGVCVCV